MSLTEEERARFLSKVWLVLGAAMVMVAGVVFVWKALGIALTIFGGVLLGLFLHALAEIVERHTPLGHGVCLGLVLVSLLVVGGGLGWLLGPAAVDQFGQLAQRLPGAFHDLQEWLRQFWLGRLALQSLPTAGGGSREGIRSLLGRVTGLFTATLGAFTTLFVILFLGIYIAATPATYKRGLVWLAPPSRRDRVTGVLSNLSSALRSWMIGRFSSMVVVTIIVATGLWLLGIPLVLSLSLLAGLLTFVPVLGAIASAVPAVILAWSHAGGQMVIWVGLLYWGAHLVETFVSTPLIQRRVVHIPPALLISAQIVMGLAGGVLGVVFATPLAVVVVVLVQTFYEEGVLDEDVEVWGS